MYDIIAQIFGIIGMAVMVVSFQAKKQKTVIILQMVGAVMFIVNFFMLGAITGALLNVIALFRGFVYANKEKIKHLRVFTGVFIALYFVSYACTFLVFGKAPTLANFIVELLPVIAMVAVNISFYKTSAAAVRKFALISSPSWLIYNSINFSIGGILCETFSLISVILGIIRLDLKRNKAE